MKSSVTRLLRQIFHWNALLITVVNIHIPKIGIVFKLKEVHILLEVSTHNRHGRWSYRRVKRPSVRGWIFFRIYSGFICSAERDARDGFLCIS